MVRKSLGVALSVVLTIFMVFGSVVSPLSGAFDVFAAENGKWIYVDGQNGNDGNDGSSAGSAVKSWDKAKELLGCAEGGIYVVGTVEASGVISTKNSSVQSVKRTADVVMFNVSGETTFANIDVDGEDKEYNSEAIKPTSGSKIYFLDGAKFHNIGYLEDKSENEKDYFNMNGGDSTGVGYPDNTTGGLVCSLVNPLTIVVDGAEFSDNKGKGIFFTPVTDGTMGISGVDVTMKSGIVKNNLGYFYHNECINVSQNVLTIYNALITNNDASNIGARYSAYADRTGVVYVCDFGQMILKSLDGAAIYGNKNFDIMTDYLDNFDDTQGTNIKFRGTRLSDTNHVMLGGGNPNWGEIKGVGYNQVVPSANAHYGYQSNPSDADKAAATEKAKSIFEGNGAVIDSNGTVQFGRYDNQSVPETPVVPTEQGCDDTPTPTAKPMVTNTTAKANGTAASEQNAAEVTITKGDAVAITDDVAFEGLAENVTYTVKSELWSNGSVQQTKTTEVTSATASPITVSFDNVSPEAQQQFNIRTVLLKDGQEVAVHNDGRNTVSERVIVKVEEPAVVYTPAIKNTTAKAKQGNGEEVSASEGAAANVTVAADEALNLTISDVIELEGLNPEKEYTLKTYLWYNGQKQLTKETTVSGDVTSLTVSFDDAVTTEASETGYNISNELYDGNEKVAEHNGSRNIVSERVTVTREEPEEPTEPETPTEPENPTPEEPTEPETPTEPENPTPDEPTEPETPTDPENPTPEQPTEPENPTPEEPAQEEPTTPAEEKVSVKISKTDMAGTEIEGAEIVIKDADGNEILCWTSDKTFKSFEVAPGTYTLEETNAPEGYQRVETKIEFEVAADGTVTVKTTAVDPAGACEVIDGVLVLKDEVKEKVDPAYEAPENDSEEHTVTVPPAEVEEEEPAVLGVYDAADEIKTADNTNGTSSGSKTKSANTGDSNDLVLYLGMVMMAGVAASALIIRRRKAEK